MNTIPMKRVPVLTLALLLSAFGVAFADQQTETIQRTLKDQGFYYGDLTGKMDPDTSAAIRRYQIRNGLKITGELDAETAKSLGVSSAAPASKPVARPQPTTAPAATPRPTIPPQAEDLRDDDNPSAPSIRPDAGYAPGPRGLRPEMSGFFDGTPYEIAPPDIQRRVIIGAQTLLARRGFYRSGIDGIYGAGMQFALRAYQSRAGIPTTGALDMDTLASLGLLPGQRAPGFERRPRFMRPRLPFAPSGERIYEPY